MAENAFVNANRHPKNNQNNEIVNNNPRTENPSSHNSTEPESTKKRKSKNVDPASSETQSRNPVRKLFQACIQCCRKKKTKIVKSKTSFVESIKEKAKKCRTKKKRSKQRAAATEHPDRVEDKQEKKIEDSKKAKRKKRKKERKKSEPQDVPQDYSEDSPTASPPDHRKLSHQILGAEAQDFTKSCCYLCAQNAMAIAAAISAQKDKSNVYIQTSVRFKERTDTTDKSCSPMMYVRTVQSSVKVRTRDMGTLHPEKKKKKKAKPKLNFKRFSIIPKVKLPGYPRVRTVACETDKSMGHNNIPQCRARHGTHCVPEKK
ncbi:uncharacterized protein LOC105663555 [Megachile rotundata]|uniref:uncharacterized protein LOC105663555 n=1 Tax=Megachile rotundata TaxID=143995 RepID=UPI003FD1C070